MYTLEQYNQAKNQGLMVLGKIDGVICQVIKNFDPKTGQELNPTLQPVDLAAIDVQMDQLRSALDYFQAFKADCEALGG